MPTLVYFKNARRDGGVRMGIEIDGDLVFHEYIPGPDEEDPALDWYVDVRCDGDGVPTDPDAAKHWLLSILPAVKEGMNQLAQRLEVGLDAESYPVSHRVANTPSGVSITIYCSAVRRVRAANIAELLLGTAAVLDREIQALPKEAPASQGL